MSLVHWKSEGARSALIIIFFGLCFHNLFNLHHGPKRLPEMET